MLASQLSPDKVASHLSQLSPEALSFLVREIELRRYAGHDEPSYDRILVAVRQLARIQELPIARQMTPVRLFCDPFEDILIDTKLGAPAPARISRASILPVWQWLTGPNGPENIAGLVAELSSIAVGDDDHEISRMQQQMIDVAARAIDTEIALAEESPKRNAQLVALLGGEDVLADVKLMASSFHSFVAIKKLRSAIPARISILDNGISQQIDFALKAYNLNAPGLPEHGFATLLARMTAPTKALRIAVHELSTDVASRVAQSAFAPLGELLLSDLEIAAHQVDRLVSVRAKPEDILEALDRYHLYADGICREIDISTMDKWGKSVAASRHIASKALDSELRGLPSQMSSVFKPYINGRKAKDITAPDQSAIADVLRASLLRRDCRQFMGQLSLNEAAMLCDQAILPRLTMINDALIDDLRSSAGGRQEMTMEWFKAAVPLTRAVLGEAEADLFVRSGRVASQCDG